MFFFPLMIFFLILNKKEKKVQQGRSDLTRQNNLTWARLKPSTQKIISTQKLSISLALIVPAVRERGRGKETRSKGLPLQTKDEDDEGRKGHEPNRRIQEGAPKKGVEKGKSPIRSSLSRVFFPIVSISLKPQGQILWSP